LSFVVRTVCGWSSSSTDSICECRSWRRRVEKRGKEIHALEIGDRVVSWIEDEIVEEFNLLTLDRQRSRQEEE